MITDFNDPSIGPVVVADVCIIGAGAAGIAMANKYIDSGQKVLLLESGGINREEETEALNKLTINDDIDSNIDGVIYSRSESCRQRFFGGTTNHWSGWCRPLDEIDFKQRDWVPGSGWPIQQEDLIAYYNDAEGYCDLGDPIFEIEQAESVIGELPEYSVDKLKSVLWTVSAPTRFGIKYRDQLSNAENIEILLHANVVEIVTGESEDSVTSLRIRSLKGKESSVVAKQYVVACGALENARLLLSSNNRNPLGVGNQSTMVGKNYQNHPHIYTALVQAIDPEALTEMYERTHTPSGNRLVLGLAGSEQAQKQGEILNFGATIPLSHVNTDRYMREIWSDLKSGKMPTEFYDKVKRLIVDFTTNEGEKQHEILLYTEQAPNEESKVILTNEKDAVGMPRIRMDWQLNELDKHTARVGTQLIAEEFGRLNLGKIRMNDWVMKDSKTWPSMWGGCHHIGTTRMSVDSQDGVVDGNCKVHGVDNLYIAGSSVFPTGGHAPPTFTIVALALRLADHLQG